MNFLIQLIILLIHLVQSFLLLHISLPTRISKSSTLFNNILSNLTCFEEIGSGNVASTFSEHSPKFIFLKDLFSKISAAKSNILRYDWRKFEYNEFIPDFDQTC